MKYGADNKVIKDLGADLGMSEYLKGIWHVCQMTWIGYSISWGFLGRFVFLGVLNLPMHLSGYVE